MEFTLRPWRREDVNRLAAIADNPRIASNMMDIFPHPYTMEAGMKFIEMTLLSEPRQILAIEIDGQVAGAIGIHPMQDVYRLNAEMGYWLAEEYWGKGIMSEVITWMTAYAFSHFPIERIFAKPYGTNIASQRVLEKAGFILEGRFEKTLIKNDELKDELVYAIRRNTAHQ
jgi:ribosomal-protein-alanine N-acetyltransferase